MDLPGSYSADPDETTSRSGGVVFYSALWVSASLQQRNPVE